MERKPRQSFDEPPLTRRYIQPLLLKKRTRNTQVSSMLPSPSTKKDQVETIPLLISQLKFMPKKPADEGQRQEDRAYDRELLHHLVLTIADRREVQVGATAQQIAIGIDQIGDTDQVVIDVAEVVALVQLEAGDLREMVNRARE